MDTSPYMISSNTTNKQKLIPKTPEVSALPMLVFD